MKATLALLTIVTVLQGCKISEQRKANYDLTKSFPGLEALTTKSLSDEEMAIGKRICNAIKSKRVHFETLPNQTHKLLLLAENKGCGTSIFSGLGEFQTVLDNSNSTDMEYRTTARTDSFQDVITDATMPISAYCKAFSDGAKNVSNSVFDGEYKYIFYFKVIKNAADNIDAYEMNRYKRDARGDYFLQYAENNSFYTNTVQIGNSNLVGLERTRERYNMCPVADQYSVYRETLRRPLTSF